MDNTEIFSTVFSLFLGIASLVLFLNRDKTKNNMNKLTNYLSVFFGVPFFIILMSLVGPNERSVAVGFDFFIPGIPIYTIVLPLYAIIWGALSIGIVIGFVLMSIRQTYGRRLEQGDRRKANVTPFYTAAENVTVDKAVALIRSASSVRSGKNTSPPSPPVIRRK